MGNKLNRQNMQLKELMSRFDELQKIPQRNITYLQDKQTHKQFVLKEATFNDQKEFNKNVEKLLAKKAALENQPHVVQLSEYLVRTEDQYCSTFYKIYALFEYPYKTLQDEIHQRQLQHRRFLEKELWSILASCILGLSHLQKYDIRHQSLKSNTILLTNDGLIKVADPYCTSQPSNFQILLTKRTTPHIYLSPELCESLAQQITSSPVINPYKSDVFTVAMIMLEAGLLQYQDECYRDEYARIHWDTIQYNLDRFGENYSNELKSTLQSMLQQAQQDRPEWTDLEAHVKVGEDSESIDNTRVQTPMSRQRQTRQSQTQAIRNQSNISSNHPSHIGLSAVSNLSANVGAAGPHDISPQSMATTVVQQIPQPQFPQKTTNNQPIQAQQRSSSQGPVQLQHHYTNRQNAPQPVHTHTAQQQYVTTYHQSNFQSQPPAQRQPLVNPIPTIKKTQVPMHITPTVSTVPDQILPVKQSIADTVRPKFSLNLPNSLYNTQVKNDQNLVEVYEGNEFDNEQDNAHAHYASNNNPAILNANGVQAAQSAQNVQKSILPTTIVSPKTIQQATPAITSSRQSGTTINVGSKISNANPNFSLPNHQYIPIQTSTPTTTLPNTGFQQNSTNTTFVNQSSWQTSPSNPMPAISSVTPNQNTFRISNSINANGVSSNLPQTISSGLTSQYQPATSFMGGALSQYSTTIPPSTSVSPIYTPSSVSNTGSSFGSQFYQPQSFNLPSTNYQQFTPSQLYQPPSDLATNLSKTATFGFTQVPLSNNYAAPNDRIAKASESENVEHLRKPQRTNVIQIFKQGSKYQGQKLNDMRDGHGKFYYQDGGLYDGEWKENKMSGHGKLFYQSHKIAYDGDWSNDQFTGFGILYNEEPVASNSPFDYSNLDEIDEYWTRFQGEFFDDLKHGKGKLFLSNGEWFEGIFDKDTATGPGTFHTIKGETVEGIWNNNQLQR